MKKIVGFFWVNIENTCLKLQHIPVGYKPPPANICCAYIFREARCIRLHRGLWKEIASLFTMINLLFLLF